MVAPAKLLTRDARKVERKKSGQLKARKKFTVRICLGTASARVLRLNHLIYVVICGFFAILCVAADLMRMVSVVQWVKR